MSIENSSVLPEDDPNHQHNFLLLIAYQCFLRVGWIFKTESVIMPAVLDAIGGAGWVRGCLPVLNRFGQSVPPLLTSGFIRGVAHKKFFLILTTTMMAKMFLLLSAAWWMTGGSGAFFPFLFLSLYGVFFCATGLNQLTMHTLTGKLIQTRRRGALSLFGTLIGSGSAILGAYFFLSRWLSSDPTAPETSRFDLIFLATGICFLVSSALATMFKERADAFEPNPRSGFQLVKDCVASVRNDRNFLLLAVIAGLFGMSITLFPHYQRMGRDTFNLSYVALIPWVIAQNLGVAVFSIPSGWASDRFGTRVVLRWILAALTVPPVLAVVLSRFEGLTSSMFVMVFFMLGITPVAMRFFNFYTLEITERENHPLYLSTISISLAVPPVLMGIPIGWLVEEIGFQIVFLVVASFLVVACLLTFFLIEPRHQNPKTGTTG